MCWSDQSDAIKYCIAHSLPLMKAQFFPVRSRCIDFDLRLNDDKETMKRMYEVLGDTVAISVWQSAKRYEEMKSWAYQWQIAYFGT